jgi:predicted secreted Zn-dependent protease
MTLVLGSTSFTSYDVTASTLADVVSIISGRSEAGECTWAIAYTYESVGRDGKPRGLSVDASINILMPNWVGRDSARAVERVEWDRFRAALRAHEDGHDSRARVGIQALHDKLEDTAARRLPTVYAAEKRRIQRESNAYDHATNHGQRPPPGTIITIPAPPRP